MSNVAGSQRGAEFKGHAVLVRVYWHQDAVGACAIEMQQFTYICEYICVTLQKTSSTNDMQ